jgi:hypothetical protein
MSALVHNPCNDETIRQWQREKTMMHSSGIWGRQPVLKYLRAADASHHGADRSPRQGDRSILGPLGETRMLKISTVVAIALMLTGAGVWATSTTRARIDVPAGTQINPLQITMGARNLPVAHYDDYSLEFH